MSEVCDKEKANNKRKIFSGLLWRFAERCGAQGVSFIVTIILARLLEPEVYGNIALVTIFTTILQTFVDSGMGGSLIQKKDADDLDFSSVFYFNIVMCSIMYIVIFIAAPHIASYYGILELKAVIRVLGLTIIISGVKNIQQAYVGRNMLFKRFFWATLVGTIGAAFIGISMAFLGYGIWALVAQHIFNTTFDMIILWVTVKWRPQKMFSVDRLKGLFSYGWKLFVSSLINAVYEDARQLIIGKMYSSADLAYYNRGKQFPSLVINNANISIDSVLFPAMSKEQENIERIRKMIRRSIKVSVYIVAPLLIGIAITASSLVEIILTDKWSACVPYLRIFCVIYSFYPIRTANQNAILALGRSDLALRQQIFQKIIGIILLLVTVRQGVMAIAYGLLLDSVIGIIISSWPNRKLLRYGFERQLRDIMPSILLAVFMGICISFVSLLDCSSLIILFLQVILGAGIYIMASIAFKNDSFIYLLGILKDFAGKRRK